MPYTEVAKGYEMPGDAMVILTDDDLASLPVASSKSIEVQEFVPLESIDPIYFDRSYYLEPQRDAVKPYLLLRDALVKYGRVAIGKIALRQREALAVLRVYADVILVNTMLWPDEVREPDFPFLREPPPQVRPPGARPGGFADRFAVGPGVRPGQIQGRIPGGAASADRGQDRGQGDHHAPPAGERGRACD